MPAKMRKLFKIMTQDSMSKKNYLQVVVLTILYGGFCLVVHGNESQTESFETLKETIIKLKKNGKTVYYGEFFNTPFEKHINSEKPFVQGAFIYNMFHDRELHHFTLRLIMKYMKNNPVSLAKRQEILNFLLSNMTTRNPEWMRIDAMFMLMSFNDREYYNEESRKIIKDLLLKDGCKRYALFLIDRADIYNDPEIIKFLKKQSENYRLWSWENRTPWIALLILARHGNKDAMKRIVELANIPNKKERSSQVQLMPLQLAYVQHSKIVELLRQFLKSKESYFHGEDAVPQSADLSHASARALSNMIIGYPKISRWGYTDAERKKCIDWFDKHNDYKFDKDAKLLFY
jgi:hypothetical protein